MKLNMSDDDASGMLTSKPSPSPSPPPLLLLLPGPKPTPVVAAGATNGCSSDDRPTGSPTESPDTVGPVESEAGPGAIDDDDDGVNGMFVMVTLGDRASGAGWCGVVPEGAMLIDATPDKDSDCSLGLAMGPGALDGITGPTAAVPETSDPRVL